MRSRLGPALVFILLCAWAGVDGAIAQDSPTADAFLADGKLADGDRTLEATLRDHPDDDRARFGLGLVRFVAAIERLAQGFHEHGFEDTSLGGNMIPFARLPIPANPDPRPTSYDDLRAILLRCFDDLARAEATLAPIKDASVKLPIHFARIRLDLDGDGRAGPDETLWSIYAKINPPRQPNGQAGSTSPRADGLPIHFDRGDVAWLRGYCHLLSAILETYLALDGRDLFEHTGHMFFARPVTPFSILKHRDKPGNDGSEINDLVAFVHLQRYAVKEPARMVAALDHLKAMIRLSRESWSSYLAETDDDHEWLPNPRQKPSVPWAREVSDAMVGAWKDFLDEAEKILDGKLLVPFWRDAGGKGLNLRRAFIEPKEYDIILWAQGPPAVPYLEDGPLSNPQTWNRFLRVFNGEFIGYAFWFN